MYGWKAVGGRFCVHTWYVQRVQRGFGGGMYIWKAVGGRFCVHTWYVLRGEGGFGGGMYIWKAVGGRFCVHTWYVQREKTGSGGSMCRVWAGRLVAGAGIAKSPTRPVLDDPQQTRKRCPGRPSAIAQTVLRGAALENLSKSPNDSPGEAWNEPSEANVENERKFF